MTLQELIDLLKTYDQDTVVPHGFDEPHSYRGFYEQLAFEPCEDQTVGQMLAAAQSALGQTYSGYKGGDYTMRGHTIVNLARYSECGNEINEPMIRAMLDAPELVRLRDENAELRRKLEATPAASLTHEDRDFDEILRRASEERLVLTKRVHAMEIELAQAWSDYEKASKRESKAWGQFHCTVAERTERDQHIAMLRTVLTNLLAKLDVIVASPSYQAVWSSAHVHGVSYDGPTWQAEVAMARAVLAPSPAATLKAEA